MKQRLLTMLSMVVGFILTTYGANIFTISQVQGHPGDEVTVTVSLDNTDEVVVAELQIPLDNQLMYVDGSCVLNADRINGHQVTAGVKDGILNIVMYTMDLKPLRGNSGELLTFKLNLKKEPKSYPLSATALLGSADGDRFDSDVNNGAVTILSPKINIVTPSVDYGHIPIRSTYTQNIVLQNVGNETLQVSQVNFSANEFSVSDDSFSIDAGETHYLTVTYAPVNRGAVNEKVTFVSNSVYGDKSVSLMADPFSVNELHVGSALGISDEEVTISLTMNNMEPIVGVQCEFTLPEQLVYVANSFKASQRANGLSATSSITDGKLKLILYSFTESEIVGNDGEIATFRVKLNGNTGWYGLNPENVVLSNASVENMTSATSGGSVQIKSPSINCNDKLKMGDCAIDETSKAKYTISNYGEVSLTINKVTFLTDGYSIAEQLPMNIAPWQSKDITIEYTPSVKGEHSTIMQIYTNDPQNRMKSVIVEGNIYEPNSLLLSGEYTDNGYDLSVSLNNYNELVALQMDVHWLNGMNAPSDGIRLSSRLNGLSSTVSKMGEGVYRVVIFSLNNTPISGNEGEIFTLSYFNDGTAVIDNSKITIDNLVFSTSKSENVSSESIYNYKVPSRLAQSIALDKTEVTMKTTETTTLSVTVLPENAIVKEVVWTSSDESVASVKDGVVTAHKVGEATITASTTDGSNLSASCKVTVMPTQAQSIALDKTEVTMKATETTTLSVTVLPENAIVKEIVWSSSDESVASVKDGVVTAHKVGEANITATMPLENNNSNANEWTAYYEGTNWGESTVYAYAWDAGNGNYQHLGRWPGTKMTRNDEGKWYINFTVDKTMVKPMIIFNNGRGGGSNQTADLAFTNNGVYNYNGLVYVSFESLKANCKVTVVPTIAEMVEIKVPEKTSLIIGETLQLEAMVYPETSTDKSVSWSSSNENVANVDENGKVSAVGCGEVEIISTTSNGLCVSIKLVVLPSLGDINCDGEVNVTDVVKLYSYILGHTTDIEESVVDLNGDGEVNVSDIVKLYSIILSSN